MRHFYLVVVLAVGALLCHTAYAQTLSDELTEIATQYNLAGMSVAVVKEGQPVFIHHYGLADISRNIPVTDTTQYRIASVSKMVTAIGFMQLYEQGLFGLDDNISNILGYTVKNPYYPTTPITPRMLLAHTSSLRDGAAYDNFLTPTYNQTPPPPIYQLLTDTGAYYQTALFQNRTPGTYFQYANVNYGIIGTLIEKLSGQRFDQYMRQHVLLPMGITGSFNVNDITNINNVSVLYRKTDGNWTPQADNYQGIAPLPPNLSGYVPGSNGLRFGPQGGLRISAAELARFAVMFLQNGSYNNIPILQDSTVQLMKTVQWQFNGSNGNNYYNLFNSWGLGMQQTTNTPNADIVCPDMAMWGHAGEAYGLVSDFYFADEGGVGLIFVTNGCGVGYDVPANSAFYHIEADVFNAVCTYLPQLEVPVVVAVPYQTSPIKADFPVILSHAPGGWLATNLGGSVCQIWVYDLLGKPVLHTQIPAMTSETILAPAGLSSGMYLVRLQAADVVKVLKMQ